MANVVEMGLDTAKGDEGGRGEGDVGGGEAHGADTGSNVQNLARKTRLY